MFKTVSYWVIVILVFSVMLGCTKQDNTPPLIPMKDFFRNPVKASYQLSPNGEYLAYMQPWENRMNVYVQKIGTEDTVRVTSATERDIAGYFWANNSRLAYVQDKGGDENFKLYAVNSDGTNERVLTPFDEVRVQIIDDLEDNENEMIIGLNKRNKQIFDAYRIDINTGEMKMIGENPGNISGWMTDNDGQLRIASTTDGVNTSILYREKESDPFKTVLTTNFRETLAPLYFTFDNKYIYASSNLGRDKQAIVKYDIANAKELEVLYQHPEVDVDNLLRSKKRKVITGVMFITDKRHYHFFDEQRKLLQKELQEKLPDYEVVVSNMSKDENKALVRTYSDKTRGAYYFYNLETKDFRKLDDISPWLNEAYMADMQPIKYQSRDGLTINGYMTLPKGVPEKDLPVVVNPHGGPWARDYWGFNSEVPLGMVVNSGKSVLKNGAKPCRMILLMVFSGSLIRELRIRRVWVYTEAHMVVMRPLPDLPLHLIFMPVVLIMLAHPIFLHYLPAFRHTGNFIVRCFMKWSETRKKTKNYLKKHLRSFMQIVSVYRFLWLRVPMIPG